MKLHIDNDLNNYHCVFASEVDGAKFCNAANNGYYAPEVATGNPPRFNNKLLLKKFLWWNRFDLIDDFYSEATRLNITGLPDVNELCNEINDAKIKRLGSEEKGPGERSHVWAGLKWQESQWNGKNKTPAGWIKDEQNIPTGKFVHYNFERHSLIIHLRSVISFLKGEPGNAYTGIVALKKYKNEVLVRARPKIFLLPVQPSIGESNNTRAREIYSVRQYNNDFTTNVYKQEKYPITHQGNGQAAHNQLIDSIREAEKLGPYKYMIPNDEGNFIGFTVSKGCAPSYENNFKSFKNRYAFTSQTANTSSFELSKNPSIYTSQEWGEAISTACDKLLDLEKFLIPTKGSKANAIRYLENLIAQRYQQSWRELREKFWPAPITNSLNINNSTQYNDEDDWETGN